MNVWVLIHQYCADGDAGYVVGVYATAAAASAARLACVRDIMAEGRKPYVNPDNDEVDDDWDEDYVVEKHAVRV